MTNDKNESDEDIASDVLPAAIDDDAVPILLDRLFPWHRPRKQFVRERQWVEHSRRLIDKLKNGHFLQNGPGGKPEIKYLTLPGIDYLDVRELASCCANLNVGLTITGFLAGGEKNPARARAQFREESLKEAGHISDRSSTFSRRFEEISSVNGQAYRDLRRRGPFQVINVDACGSIALPSAGHAHRMVDAIFRIVELQLELCTSRWLLFLTADVTKESYSVAALQNMSRAIAENAEGSREFSDGTISLLADSDITVVQAIDAASESSGERFVKLFSLGFAKWIMHLAGSKDWHLKMHNSYFYSTTPESSRFPSMPCLAFEFIPPSPGLEDQFDVTNVEPLSRKNEENFAMRALSKVSEMEDLDERMFSDHTLRAEMIATTKNMLREIGYTDSALKDLDKLDRAPAV